MIRGAFGMSWEVGGENSGDARKGGITRPLPFTYLCIWCRLLMPHVGGMWGYGALYPPHACQDDVGGCCFAPTMPTSHVHDMGMHGRASFRSGGVSEDVGE
jgi:hypothetical protein